MLLIGSAAVFAAAVVQPGRTLKITVTGHPEFTETLVVGRDGTIEYPLLAGIPLDGLSAREVRELLTSALARVARDAEIFVIISDVQQIRTQVYGAVRSPGKFIVESPLNLQQILAMAGNLTETADPSRIRIIRSARMGRDETVVDLTRHFHSDSLQITPDVLDGDVVVVPELTPATSVRVFGEVRRPGEILLAAGDNIFDSIQRAGGITADADLKRVIHFSNRSGRYSSGKWDVAKALGDASVAELPLAERGDIIVVPRLDDWRKFSWWLLTLRDFAYLASTIVLLIQVL